MLDFAVQARSNQIDIFGMFTAEKSLTLRTKPVEFMMGKRTTDPEYAMLTLDIKTARDLANRILRAAGKDGS